MSTLPEIRAYWCNTYPTCAPVGYWLRNAYRDRWVRFHSLPESKRYPETESEYQIVLHRHSSVLSELASSNEQLVFLSTGYSETPEPIRDDLRLEAIDPDAQHWETVAMHELEGEEYPNYWHMYMSVWPWAFRVFDPVLRLVADNVVANTMIVSMKNQWVYHPYDGGADVVLRDPETRNGLKKQFELWLSKHPEGL